MIRFESKRFRFDWIWIVLDCDFVVITCFEYCFWQPCRQICNCR